MCMKILYMYLCMYTYIDVTKIYISYIHEWDICLFHIYKEDVRYI